MLNLQLILRRLSALLLCPARNLTDTMTAKDVSEKITAAMVTFVYIDGKPTDNNLLRLRELPTPILLGIPYNTADGAHKLWGILYSNAAYKTRHNTVFISPTRPTIYPTISDGATSAIHSFTETTQNSPWKNYNMHKATERVC